MVAAGRSASGRTPERHGQQQSWFAPLRRGGHHSSIGRAGSSPAAGVVPARRVVIVDDEALVAMALEAMVLDAGHVVLGIATDADAGVALAEQLAPDVVLMDVRFGTAQDAGIIAATRIRASTQAEMIFVTAQPVGPITHQIARTIPGAKVLAKPVDPVELADAIAAA